MSENEKRTYTYKDEYERRYGSGGEKGTKPQGMQSKKEDDEKSLLCILCYLGPLFLIPFFAQRSSRFAVFHSNQGLLLLIFSVLGQLLSKFVPLLGWAVSLCISILVLIGMIMGMYNVCVGEEKELPFIGWIRILH